MIYYAKDNKLYSSDIPVTDSSFVEISEEEYNRRMNEAVSTREKGTPATENNSEDIL